MDSTDINYHLQDFFASLEDPRRGQGQRHTLSNVLTIVIMAILTGEKGFRGFFRFAQANAKELTTLLAMKHGIPGYNTIRDILLAINQDTLIRNFINWTQDYLPSFSEDQYIALDGKAIKATTNGGNTSQQNFVSVVNAFGHKSGIIHGMQPFENGKASEVQALQKLVSKLGVKHVVFTLDALHTKKNI